MNKKSWLKFFIYILLIFIVLNLGNYICKAASLDEHNPFALNITFILIYGSIGFILGFEHFLCELKKDGIWKINIPKLILLGIPSLYFSIIVFIYLNNTLSMAMPFLSSPIGEVARSKIDIISIFQLILGYTIITSFYKINVNAKSIEDNKTEKSNGIN